MHHVCMLGKCILSWLLWDNPLSHWVEREEESKGPQACHPITISRLLGCSSHGCTIESPKILPKLLISWAGPQRFWFNWLGVLVQLGDCRSFPGEYNGPASSPAWTQRQAGRQKRSTEAKTLSDVPDLLPSLLPVPREASTHGCQKVSHCSSHPEAGCVCCI